MKAVIYARVSSVSDRQNTERQICDLQAYASNNNYSIVNVFSEHISGATKNEKRTTLMECLNFALENNVNIVLFSELSRLGRNVLEIIEVVKWFSDNKINAYFQKENTTLLNQNGEVAPTTTILISCLGMVAQIERENIAYRLSSGRKLAIERGIKMGRKVGYRKPEKDKQQQYKEVIKYLKKGLSVATVLKCCKSDGIKVSERTIWSLKREFC